MGIKLFGHRRLSTTGASKQLYPSNYTTIPDPYKFLCMPSDFAADPLLSCRNLIYSSKANDGDR